MSNEGTSTSPGSDREEAHCSQVSNPVSSIDRNMLRRCAPRSPPFHPRMCAPWRHRQIGGPVGDLASSTENRHRTLHISLVKPFEEHAGFERVISRVQTQVLLRAGSCVAAASAERRSRSPSRARASVTAIRPSAPGISTKRPSWPGAPRRHGPAQALRRTMPALLRPHERPHDPFSESHARLSVRTSPPSRQWDASSR